MKVGDKITPKWSESFCDHVTKGKIYEVVEIKNVGFFIINDKGKKCFPISTTYIKVFWNWGVLIMRDTVSFKVRRLKRLMFVVLWHMGLIKFAKTSLNRLAKLF